MNTGVSHSGHGTEYLSDKILVFTITEMEKSIFYNGYTYIDTMNGEAVRNFIEKTHEKYKEKCGERFGKSIKGIFTDEPHRGQLMSNFGSETVQACIKIWSVPFTEKLFDEFRDRFGYDLLERLPELFLQYKGEKISTVKWKYVDTDKGLWQSTFNPGKGHLDLIESVPFPNFQLTIAGIPYGFSPALTTGYSNDEAAVYIVKSGNYHFVSGAG